MNSIKSTQALLAALGVILSLMGELLAADPRENTTSGARLQAVLVRPEEISPKQISEFAAAQHNGVVLYLDEKTPAARQRAAARQVEKAGLDLFYWIEVARNPALADSHPEWMASLQTHPEWRRHFPNFPKLETNQVAKTYPWVPVLYGETFEVHRRRVADLLKRMPSATGVFLNDLQGAPSACGCGNDFCRWTADYGPIHTATRLPNDAAARFVSAVAKLMPKAKIIPVWTTECAEQDHPKGAACDGVACFTGKCWREYNTQLMPVADSCERIGVLLPFRDFPSALSRTGSNAEWQQHALRSFTEILPQRDGRAIPQGRLIAVLQGWEVNPEQQRTQIRQAEEAGTAGYVMALTKIDQSWEPRLMTLPKSKNSAGSGEPHAGH